MRGFFVAVGFCAACCVAALGATESSDGTSCAAIAVNRAPQSLLAWLSPRMPYSLTQWPAMHAAAQRSGWQVRAVWDANVPRAEVEAALKAAPHPLLPPAQLRCSPPMQVLPHHPYVEVSTQGHPQAQPLLGVMPESAWLQVLAQRAAKPSPKRLAAASEARAAASALPILDSACIPANEYIALDTPTPQADLGSYERVSPDGRFILRSFSGARITQVSLVELRPATESSRIRLHATGLSNEAFPVQGTWRYLVDVTGEHYRFKDVLQQGPRAPVQFKGGMTGFYAAASEMKDAQGRVWLRSLSWPGAEAGQNASDDSAGQLQTRAIRIADNGAQARVEQDTGAHFLCGNRRPVDGAVYALPMISVDGTEFSALPQTPPRGQSASMRVFALTPNPASQDHSCTQTADLRDAPSKAVFGFTTQSPVAYTDNGWVKWVDRRDPALHSYALDEGRRDLLASAFPGVTRDGRIVFAATWKDCPSDSSPSSCTARAGYVIADPYQQSRYLNATRARGQAPHACITHAQVSAERQSFADFHQIAP